ncbi:MAG: hypothetical protein KJ914_01605, partial [Gammaproteobacteria bacterium]|nr:hypothetical protein [Gammaproteobacteria bacterium]MBU2005548.1 hypothetical protein [Gammaproteobacteria bacterium]
MEIKDLLKSLKEDISLGWNLSNSAVSPHPSGDTNTGLDRLVTLLVDDMELNRRIPTSEIAEAARAANELNSILVEAIRSTGVANDGWINAADMYEISNYIRNDEVLKNRWAELHGDDEGNEETGFHLAQNDGAVTQLFGQNAVNTVMDGLYHIGFEIRGGRFLNEDGNSNVSLEQAADWLNDLLATDLMAGTLKNAAIDPYAHGSTGTGLDRLVEIIGGDDALNRCLSTSDINTAAHAADEMNKILVEAIKATGAADEGKISEVDLRDVSNYIRDNYQEAWISLHGDDEGDEETGFHLVQNDGALKKLYGQNAINTVADGIYHIGFVIDGDHFLNEDGNRNQTLSTVKEWLNDLLTQDLKAGTLMSDPITVDPDAISQAIVFHLDDVVTVNGRPAWNQPSGHVETESLAELALANGTISLGFIADNPQASGTQTLFSKDAYGTGNGEVVAYLCQGKLYVRIQDDGKATYLDSGEYFIEAGQRYDMTLSIGDGGVQLYLNGVKVDNDPQLEFNWVTNGADLLVGASGQGRSDSNPTWTWDYFDGTIEDFTIYDRALDRAEVKAINQAGPLPAFGVGDITLEAEAMPDTDAGTGLIGEIFDRNSYFSSVSDLENHIASTGTPTHTFNAKAIDYGNHNNDNDVGGFLGDNGALTSGSASTDMTSIGVRLSGYIYLDEGEHEITVRSDDGYVLKLGGETFSSYQSPRPFYATSQNGDFASGLYEFELLYYENGGGEGLRLEIDGEVVGPERFYCTVEDFTDALDTYGAREIEEQSPNDGSPILADTDQPAVYEGTGLVGRAFDSSQSFYSLDQLQEYVANNSATHGFIASQIDFGGANQHGTVGGFLGDNGELTHGNADTAMETAAVHLTGFVYIPQGEHRITVRSDDGYLLKLGGQEFSSYESPRPFYATNKVDNFDGGLYEVELFYYENYGAEGLRIELDGKVLGAENFFQTVQDFNAALAEYGPMPEGGMPELNPLPEGTTGTGLDQIVDLIMNDPELNRRLVQQEIEEGARAADALNGILVEAIRATGVANDGTFTASDMHDLNSHIQANYYDKWIELHGDDEASEETGFHLVQNDGGVTRLFNDNAINTVADGLYHIGFNINGDRFLNEDGNNNARLETTAYWLNQLLASELASGSLSNTAVDPEV